MTCFSGCPPCAGCEELRRRAEAAERALAEQGSIVEWVHDAVRGEPVSEFAEGFGVVAAVVALREECEARGRALNDLEPHAVHIRLLTGQRDRWERVARQLYLEYADYAAEGDADVTPLEWFVKRYGEGGDANG